MRFVETSLPGVFVVELEPRQDERGAFARTFCQREFGARGLHTDYPQCNLSRNRQRGTFRGMHYQVAPHQEVKLVRCGTGAIFDVVVDLRAGSPTRFQWIGVHLDARSGRALYIPAGFAHGFATLEPDTDVFYQMGAFYAPEAARGFRWNDPMFKIGWPLEPQVISERDAGYPDFQVGHGGEADEAGPEGAGQA